jgi:hypothetical protein
MKYSEPQYATIPKNKIHETRQIVIEELRSAIRISVETYLQDIVLPWRYFRIKNPFITTDMTFGIIPIAKLRRDTMRNNAVEVFENTIEEYIDSKEFEDVWDPIDILELYWAIHVYMYFNMTSTQNTDIMNYRLNEILSYLENIWYDAVFVDMLNESYGNYVYYFHNVVTESLNQHRWSEWSKI